MQRGFKDKVLYPGVYYQACKFLGKAVRARIRSVIRLAAKSRSLPALFRNLLVRRPSPDLNALIEK